MNKITTVKELPDSEKPYEKFLTYGPEYLSDAELLAVIIRSGTSGLKSVEVAQNLLKDAENTWNWSHKGNPVKMYCGIIKADCTDKISTKRMHD